MASKKQTAILVVSFGTSYETARIRDIETIEQDIYRAFPEAVPYRAWTSKKIIAKLLQRDQLHIPTVTEAMEQMQSDGITDVIIQPTHMIDGFEYNKMKDDALVFKNNFSNIVFGTPLLSKKEDQLAVIDAIVSEFSQILDDETALVLMGHGSMHTANHIYGSLHDQFHQMGHTNVFLGTVEAYPDIDVLIEAVKSAGCRKVCLAPFLIVAGDHATNDMAGDAEDSWKCIFQKSGFDVQCILKGLGEYPSIRSIFVKHAKTAMEVSD